MYKSFLVLVFVLFGFTSHQSSQALGQAAPPKDRPLPTTNQTNSAMAASTDPSPTAKSLYEEGIKRVELGQVSEAVERFQQAVTLDPEYAEAYSALGRAFFKLRQWENASGNLRRAISLKAKQKTQVPLQNLKRETPSTTPSESKPPTPNKNVTDAKPPGMVSLATSPTTKPALQSHNSAGARTLNAEVETAQLRSTEPGTATDKLSPGEVGGNAAMKTPVTQSPPATKAVQLSETRVPQLDIDEGNALVPKQESTELPMATTVTLSALGESKPIVPVSLKSSNDEVSLTHIYRVGPRDVLDVRLNNSQSAQPTVFVVTESGLLEHPKLTEPLPVMGLTVEEIAARLENHLRTRVLIENPKVSVEVLDHASHAIVVSGLVKAPGTKMLKSEATPLLIVLAEVQPLPEAWRVTVVRNQTQILETELHTTDMKFLIQPGDVVTIHPNTTQFVYVGGRVRFPGEKRYHHGLTLVQAIMAAGGEPTKSNVAEISRGEDQGSPVRTRVDLKAIELGEAADPVLRPGDRIMVLR